MPQLTNFLLQNGFPQEMIVWLFFLPIAVTLVVAARQVVGIKGLGIASPALIGFAVASLGIQAGILVFSVVFAMGFAARAVLARVRLLYLPKSGLIIVFAILGLIALLPFFPYRENLNSPLAAVSLVIIVLSMEQFAALLLEQGPRRTLGALLETALVALPIAYLVGWRSLQDFVLSYPLFIFAGLIVLNFLLGKWTGLRISELIRFKSIIFK